MNKIIDIQGEEQSIGELSVAIVSRLSREKLERFAKQARQDAQDYEAMALQHRKTAEDLARRATQRLSDAEYYERRVATATIRQEAAE